MKTGCVPERSQALAFLVRDDDCNFDEDEEVLIGAISTHYQINATETEYLD